MRSSTKLLAGLAALALMWAASPASAACTNGDVNGTGSMDPGDVVALLACNGTKLDPPQNPNPTACNPLCNNNGILDCGDLNADGQISTADAILALNEYNEKGSNVVPICASQGPTVPCGTIIDADITSNEVLSSCEYYVRGTVFVQPGVVLTIRPGAVIKGEAGAPTVSALVFLRAENGTVCPTDPGDKFTARINAAGTPTLPIVFTSDQPVGSRHAGDWGGVVFTGCSRVNDAGGVSNAEGLVGIVFGGGLDCAPGTNPEGSQTGTANCKDSSGLMRYVRIEFAGNELSPDNELNCLTQDGLGSHTNFTYIECLLGLDDGFEWFGGTIHEKHMVSMGNRDDNFDWQLGSDVKVQYGVTAQYKPNNDPLEDNGFEGDGNERGYTNLAMSQPQFCNMTLVGNKGQSPTIAGGHWWGALLRRGTAAQIAKTIWYNWNDGVINMRDPETGGQACTGTCSSRADGVTACTDVPYPFALPTYEPSQGTCAFGTHHGEDCTPGVGGDAFCGTANSCQKKQNLLIRNSLFYDNGSDHITHAVNRSGGANTGANCNSTEWFALLQADPSLRVLANTSYPDSATDPGIQAGPYWPPVSFVPANASNVADDPAGDGFDCGVHFSSFFDSTTYMGAFDPNGADWTITPGGWISYATQ